MRTIDLSFDGRADQKGFVFQQIIRKKDITIYKKEKEGRVYYEVFIVQKYENRAFPDRTYLAHEGLPSPEDWGECGLSTPSLSRAYELMEFLQKRFDKTKGK